MAVLVTPVAGNEEPKDRRELLERLYGAAIAALIPGGATILMTLGLNEILRTTAGSGVTPLLASLQLVAAYVACRCAVAFVRLQCAPIYPREAYYGSADVEPEPPARPGEERVRMALAIVFALLPAVSVVVSLAPSTPGPVVGLAAGLLFQARRALVGLSSQGVQQLELSLRDRYVLYLRSFGKSRALVALAALRAAHPDRVAMIVSPRRTESRVPFWYIVSVFAPATFGRLHLWSTDNAEWDRIVCSCMARSIGMVIDCAGLGVENNSGVSMEAHISIAFARDHPTAYVIERHQVMGPGFPVPVLLRADAWWSLLRSQGRLAARLRDVTRGTLPPAEKQHCDDVYAAFAREYEDVVVRDRNRAAREGREDPQEFLFARRSARQLSE